MSDVVVTINLPGEPRKNNDPFLKAVCEDAHVETIRKAVTAMMAKPSDYLRSNKDVRRIGNKRGKPRPSYAATRSNRYLASSTTRWSAHLLHKAAIERTESND